uniref:GTD-binding domain-containing protein n=1 Tax=Arundo donax TaxID=35708 RepID=A0A0A9HIQ0_ARUDO
MAMINRLQEEKAAMHMEALQYLRMMEEQADHDQEAIEKLNDLLTEREKEMLDLEAELGSYRRRLPDVPFDFGTFGATDGAMVFGVLDDSDFMRNTFFDFEDEKAKILDSLRRLEETLGMSSTANDTPKNGPLRDHPRGGGQYIDNPELGTSPLPREDLNGESVSSQQNDENQSVGNKKNIASCSHFDDVKFRSLTSVEHEVSLLNTRFKALEADQNFLKQILSSLNCSSDGVQYVQEITSHLRELRRIMAEQRDMAVL